MYGVTPICNHFDRHISRDKEEKIATESSGIVAYLLMLNGNGF